MQDKIMDYAPPSSCSVILASPVQLQVTSNLSASTVDNNSICLSLPNDVNELQKSSSFDSTNNHLYVAPIFTAAPITETTAATAVVSVAAAAAAAAAALNSLSIPKLEPQDAAAIIASQQSMSSSTCYPPTPFLLQDRFSHSAQNVYQPNHVSASISLVSQSDMTMDSTISNFTTIGTLSSRPHLFSTPVQQSNQLLSNYSVASSMNSHFQTFDYGYQNSCQFPTDQDSTTAAAAAAAAEFMSGSNVGIYDLAAAAALVSCANAPSNISQSFLNNVTIAPSGDYYYDSISHYNHPSAHNIYHNQFENLNTVPNHDVNSYAAAIGAHSNHLYSYPYPMNQTLSQPISQQHQQHLQQQRLKPSKNNHLTNLATAQQLFINSALAVPYSFPHIAAASAMSSALSSNTITSSSQSIHLLNTNEIYQNLTSSNIIQPLGLSKVVYSLD